MMTREIFVGLSSSERLDIDGVLNHAQFFKETKGQLKYFDPKCIERLNSLFDYGVEIVISSSWGYDGGKTEKRLKDAGLKLPIIGYTKQHWENWICRGNEIEEWILENLDGMGSKYGNQWNCSDYEYVILDDDCDMLYGQKDNFIKVDGKVGLTDADIEKAKKILKIETEKKVDLEEGAKALVDFERKLRESQIDNDIHLSEEDLWELLD